MRFCLLGVGYYSPLLEEVRRKIAEYHLESVIEMLPWVSHSEAMKQIAGSIFYMTVARYEGLPLAVLEAMSLGKAVVATDVTGNKDCVMDGYNGRLVELDDTKGMVDAICDMIENRELREQYGTNGRKLFGEKFTMEKRIHLLKEIYAH